MMINGIDFEIIGAIAREAGAAIMEIYAGEFNVELKGDASPLTSADRASHEIIVRRLLAEFPEIPILSEEGRDIAYAERKNWKLFWLVDPLDGTKEFIKRNGEFTVNIALIEDGQVAAGVVHVPAQDRTYLGIRGQGAWLTVGTESPVRIAVREADHSSGLTVVMSRSHPSRELAAYLEGLKVADALPVGSSLKFCVVAEGRADLYPRLGPTMEWDTAAGHAVVEGAGGRVTTVDGKRLQYNKENLLNPYFIVSGHDTRS
jgi:3'(2'), 5'-bisphosphate nucleotidase